MQHHISSLIAAGALMLATATCACQTARKEKNSVSDASAAAVPAVKFNADSAYSYIKAQVDLGTRVPGSPGHAKCVEYITSELGRHGVDTVTIQKGTVTAFTGETLPITNIMGSINPDATKRVLIAAHYDTRPWADNETDEVRRATPILGANDGASGVGVILELARVLSANRPEIGVDFLLVDAEDYGDNEGFGNKEDTWCLGTQYWGANQPYTAANRPAYGIVLDMVGGRNARFHREYYSNKAARPVVDKVWGTAARIGYSRFFPGEIGGSLIDDHLYINRAGIPCIDIVECNNSQTHSFPPTWHTLADNMSAIDTAPLKAVGQTVLTVLLEERP